MRIGVLGTGDVGRTIATKLVALGHDTTLGSRTADNEAAAAWAREAGDRGGHGTFADAAAGADLLFNCTAGAGSMEALGAAAEAGIDGKVVVDVANPLDFSAGMPPSLFVSNTDSLGEQLQRAFPQVRIVKALNTMRCDVMVDPGRLSGEHHVFLCGDDAGAKAQVAELLGEIGWPASSIVDLGDITAARGAESYLPLWLRLWGALGTADFNVAIVR
jgi:predicted dinucleotide-binding enzyme